MSNLNNYNIITLGTSGAGKTVFLSSLFKSLSIQGEHRFFLEVSDSNMERLLNKLYTEIVSGDWPTGTRGDVQKWVFTCCVKNQNLEKYPACQFTYIDYAGGILTDLDGQDEGYDFDFDQEIEKADAVLAILDGLKVLRFMERKEFDNRDVHIWMQSDIRNLMLRVQKCKKIPVHFIISKWDLLDNKYKLLEVRNRLLEKLDEFRNVVKTRADAGCPVRLIPVSSIGINFATLQADGQMKKLPGAVPRPFQVEVPLAFVLTDGLKAQINQSKKKQEEIHQRPTEIKAKYGFLNQLDQFLSNTVLPGYTTMIRQLLLVNLPEKYRNNSALQELIKLTEESAKTVEKKIERTQEEVARKQEQATQETARLRRLQEESLKVVKNEETALSHAVNSFLHIQQKLEENFPESNLGGPGI